MNDSDTDAGRLPNGITREVLERDGLRAALRARHPDVATLSDDTMRQSIASMLAARPVGVDPHRGIWLFGYGSLLWNPCVTVAQWRPARLYGYHRDFRIRLTHGRGSPALPGLMLGLVPGGSCRGQALRVTADDLAHELLMVWRREMLTGVYTPRWVDLHTAGNRLHAITFVADTANPKYRGDLDDREVVELLATGTGLIGSAADYLDNTVQHLDEQGIVDRRLRELRRRVRARLG